MLSILAEACMWALPWAVIVVFMVTMDEGARRKRARHRAMRRDMKHREQLRKERQRALERAWR